MQQRCKQLQPRLRTYIVQVARSTGLSRLRAHTIGQCLLLESWWVHTEPKPVNRDVGRLPLSTESSLGIRILPVHITNWLYTYNQCI